MIGAGLLLVPIAADAAKPPKQPKPQPGPRPLTLSASPLYVIFGNSVTLSGRLSGSNNNGRTIALDQNPYPFSGLVPAGTTKTDTKGDYRIVARPNRHTRYRTQTVDSAPYAVPVTSPEVLVHVRLRVSLRLSDSTPRRGARVRFSGFAAPKHNGRPVSIQRRARDGRWVTVARTVTRNATGDHSSYSRRVRVFRNGVFRIRVRGHADHSTGTSRTRTIRVH